MEKKYAKRPTKKRVTKKTAAARRAKRIDDTYAELRERRDSFFFAEMATKWARIGELRKLAGSPVTAKQAYKEAARWAEKAITEEIRVYKKFGEQNEPV